MKRSLNDKKIIKLYNQGNSSYKIGQYYGYSGVTILKRLRKNKVKIRNQSECKKVLNNKGKNNPNYKTGQFCNPNFCIDCKKEIDPRSIRCYKCNGKIISKVRIGIKLSKKTKRLIGKKSKAKFTDDYIERVFRKKYRGLAHHSKGGYILIKNYIHPNRDCHDYILEHILKMSKKLNRPLRKGEIVHHIDLDRKNNKISNLYLYASISDHHKGHGSINLCIKPLLERKIIIFKDGKYQINKRKVIYGSQRGEKQ